MSDAVSMNDLNAASYSYTREMAEKLSNQIASLVNAAPVLRFTTSPHWHEAGWEATTFSWHPKSEAPPLVGLVFRDRTKGIRVFEEWMMDHGNHDTVDDLRVSIIEGSPESQRFGYTVHISPNPQTLLARATAAGIVVDSDRSPLFSRVNRMYPIPGAPAMLSKFKMEYEKHREFMLAPVVPRYDGKTYFEPEYGIIKKTIYFRRLSDITEQDVDAVALAMPILVPPKG